MDLCIPAEHLKQAPGIDRTARTRHPDNDLLLLHGKTASPVIPMSERGGKRVCGTDRP